MPQLTKRLGETPVICSARSFITFSNVPVNFLNPISRTPTEFGSFTLTIDITESEFFNAQCETFTSIGLLPFP